MEEKLEGARQREKKRKMLWGKRIEKKWRRR
jgi:hypothetical protein